MLNKLIVRRTLKEQWAQCLNCLAGETLPMRQGKLDGRIEDGCRYYGHFKQTPDGNVYHCCGDKWSSCELFPDFRESDG